MILGILGPPDCGKSALAEALCLRAGTVRGRRPVYLATLLATDEHESRIQRHRARRGCHWVVRDLNLPGALLLRELRRMARRGGVILLDGVTPLLRSQMVCYALLESELDALATRILWTLHRFPGCLWIVVDTPQEGSGDSSGLASMAGRFQDRLQSSAPVIRIGR